MPANHTDFPKLVEVLDLFTARAQETLGDNLLGLYLQGSFALGAGDLHSDVDFLAIIQDDLTDEDVQAIETMHQSIYDVYPQWSSHLEGSYIPVDVIQDHEKRYTDVWYLDNGAKQLERSSHDNEDVVMWVTREHGVALYGQPPETYIEPVTLAMMRHNIQYTMQNWSKMIFDGTWHMDNLWAQPFAVMSWCRMLQTLETGEVHSKHAGLQWGLKNLDEKWHNLIEQAWQDRPNPGEKVYQQPAQDQIDNTLEFIRVALENSKKYFK